MIKSEVFEEKVEDALVGPIFVYDSNHVPTITDWGFNGWGLDAPYFLDDTVPQGVASSSGVPRVDLSATVLEGGAIEVDGNGVLMATRSSMSARVPNSGTAARIRGKEAPQIAPRSRRSIRSRGFMSGFKAGIGA